MKNEIKVLTPYEVAELKPELATEHLPVPLFSAENNTEQEILIKIDEKGDLKLFSDSADCLKAKLKKEKDFFKVKISCSEKSCDAVKLGVSQGRIDAKELSHMVANIEAPLAFRPKWLDLNYSPQVIPYSNTKRPGCNNNIPLSFMERLELFNYLAYPWCTVGKTFNSNGKVATGVLVGPNLMLTASHHAPWDKSPWWIKFVPAYNAEAVNPEPFGHSYVEAYYGIKNVDDVTGLDYVICKLYTPLGNTVGWMGSQSFGNEDNYKNGRWTSVGYPVDFRNGNRPLIEFNLEIEDIDNDGDGLELETKVFSSPGWSGGPLWGWIDNQPKVIGIMSGYEEEFSLWDLFTEDHSVSAGGVHMVNLVKYGFANWHL